MVRTSSLSLLALSALTFNALAVGVQEAELSKAGFNQSSFNVWERITGEGGVERVGVGIESSVELEQTLLGMAAELKEQMRSEQSIGELLSKMSALDYIQSTLDNFKEVSGRASGNNGCTAGTNNATASVSVGTRTAASSVLVGGFGPVPANSNVRMALAMAVPNTGASFNIDAKIGTTVAGTVTSSSTGLASASCRLYAFSFDYSFVTGCMIWTDAAYSGAC